jgi:hypothetical protein
MTKYRPKYSFLQQLLKWELMTHIMLRDELTQLTSHSKTVTGFRYPRACRIRKYQFENRSNVIFTS